MTKRTYSFTMDEPVSEELTTWAYRIQIPRSRLVETLLRDAFRKFKDAAEASGQPPARAAAMLYLDMQDELVKDKKNES